MGFEFRSNKIMGNCSDSNCSAGGSKSGNELPDNNSRSGEASMRRISEAAERSWGVPRHTNLGTTRVVGRVHCKFVVEFEIYLLRGNKSLEFAISVFFKVSGNCLIFQLAAENGILAKNVS
mgnify:CR=1 FL=1